MVSKLCRDTCTKVALKAIRCTAVGSEHPEKDILVLRYTMFFQRPCSPTGFVMIVLHVPAVKACGGGQLCARLYRKNVCPLYRCPGVELVGRVNRGGTATQAFPSLSAALMMLCRTTAVSPWQVCTSEPQQTAQGPDRRNAKNKTEGEETGRIARRRNEYPHMIQLPELPESWIQYSIENFPSTPGHRHE